MILQSRMSRNINLETLYKWQSFCVVLSQPTINEVIGGIERVAEFEKCVVNFDSMQ